MDGALSLGYAAVFALLVGAGVGLPVPEEATQIAAGVLAHQQVLELWKVMVLAWCGIVTGDSILFFLGRRHGERLLSTRAMQRVATPARRARLREHFEQDRKSTRLNSSHSLPSRMPSSA